jgi:predicted 3-demethylubiquinone-9 3-methyltransferase (glyoxalase superfamily)
MQTISTSQKIRTFLWFDTQAEEAAKFYTSLFKNSKITSISHYRDAMPEKKGTVMTVAFEIDGQEFIALNGGPEYKFTPAISLMVNCETQAEVDELWGKLTANGGEEVQCGWLTDKFGLSWQIIPEGFLDYITGDDEEGSQRAMEAMFDMKKLDLGALKKAYAGTS